MSVQRLRMFAGPNGSGKSTLKSVIAPNLLGYYLNPDDIEREVKQTKNYDVGALNLKTSREEIIHFFRQHPLIQRTVEADFIDSIHFVDNQFIYFNNVGFNSYLSAILTDFLRQKLIEAKQSFTFETVMSSVDKIQTLQKAREEGFRSYLYFVATEDPLINIARIRHRVQTGGHDVPEQKIIERFHRSLNLLLDAIRLTNRAYVFDNSSDRKVWIAEITDGINIELKTDYIPQWVNTYILEKL